MRGNSCYICSFCKEAFDLNLGHECKATTMTAREDVLNTAKKAVTQDRNLDYAAPEDNFKDISDMWNIYIRNLGRPIQPHDEAVHQIIVKISRIKQSPQKFDHWVDIAGYAACGYECINASKDGK